MAKSVAQQAALIDDEEEEIYVSPQWKLIWRRFRKHRMALVAMGVLAFLYLIGLGAEIFSMTHPEDVNTQIGYLYRQNIRWFDQGRLRPHVLGISGGINPETFQREYEVDPTDKIPVKFFARGFEYKFLGFIKVDRHIVATPIDSGRAAPYLLGTDRLGRDLWSRLMYPTRISMSIRLVGVAVSLILGVSLGGVSGYFGGVADTIIQRIIEIFGSAPTLPLWLGLAAAVPRDWGILKLYFAITLVISLFAWTDTARVVRG